MSTTGPGYAQAIAALNVTDAALNERCEAIPIFWCERTYQRTEAHRGQ